MTPPAAFSGTGVVGEFVDRLRGAVINGLPQGRFLDIETVADGLVEVRFGIEPTLVSS